MIRRAFFSVTILGLFGCTDLDHIGEVPNFSESTSTREHSAMLTPGLPKYTVEDKSFDAASLWSRQRSSLLGDRRAVARGDILTVVIEIDESAEISNGTNRSRSGSDALSIPNLFGIPQRINRRLEDGATLEDAVGISSSSASQGQGSVSRNEKLALRIAATVVEELPNGVLSIAGLQEVRVNHELRELYVTGFVRPEDISRRNEITYDKIASARVSYGGRGHISDMQQPRVGQQILDRVLPF